MNGATARAATSRPRDIASYTTTGRGATLCDSVAVSVRYSKRIFRQMPSGAEQNSRSPPRFPPSRKPTLTGIQHPGNMQQWTLTPPHGTSTGPGSDGPPHGPPLRRVAVFWIRKVHARSGAKGDRELPTHPMHSRRLPETHGTNSHLRPPAFAGYRAPTAVDADFKFAIRNSRGKASHQPR